MPFFIIFILIPFLEITVFMAVGGYIGIGTTLLLALLTAITGGMIVRYQGLQTIFSARQSMSHGGLPSKELFDGLCLVAAGAMLITPGFVTDTLGFLLLVPKMRETLRHKLSASAHFQAMNFENEFYEETQRPKPEDPDVIEGEYETLDEDNKP